MTKRCRRCGEEQPLDQFHRNRAQPDGRQSYCKACHLANNRAWAERHPEVRRAALRRQHQRHPRHPSRNCTPEQRAAHGKVERAIRAGALTRPDRCPACGKADSPIHAHHEDYAKPLDVQWMCSRCHGRLHAERKRHGQVRPHVLGSRRDGRRPAA